MWGERKSRAIVAGVLVAALALLGCGGSSSKTSASQATSTSQTSSSATVASTTTSTSSTETATTAAALPQFKISSPAFKGTNPSKKILLARYTCHGAGITPPLHWTNVPAGTKELALVIIHEGKHSGETPIDWGVAGLKPTLSGLAAGQLPPGAIVGRNSSGQARYVVCPPKNHSKEYVIALYAERKRLSVKPGFSFAGVLPQLEKKPTVAIALFH